MKILIINNHHMPKGGTERYYFDLAYLLESKGHKVAFFSTKNKNNTKSVWEKYFVKTDNFKRTGLANSIGRFLQVAYSMDARRQILKVINDFKPDIVHLNNIYNFISPSIIPVVKGAKIPIIQTVHDYHLISPNPILFYKGHISEMTKKHKFYKALLDRKTKGYYYTTLSNVFAYYLHYFTKIYNKVDIFIAPSRFMKDKLIEYGMNSKKVFKLANFIISPQEVSKSKFQNETTQKNKIIDLKKRFVLYFGQLSEHKGFLYILRLAKECPNIRIIAMGSYSDKKIERETVNFFKHERLTNLKVLTFRNKKFLNYYLRRCFFVLVPSLWYENQPYSIMEAFSFGKTVVASRIGGITEIVTNNKNGQLFDPKNFLEFKSKVLKLWQNANLTQTLGMQGYKNVVEQYSSEAYYNDLFKLYKKLLNHETN